MTSRKSNEVKHLAGTFRRQRALPPDFAALLEELPVPPKNLSDGAAAQWRALSPAVIELGISRCDLVAFALLCETLWTAEETRREIERDGYMIAAGKSGHRLHPSAPIMQAARVQAAALLTAFNLTPKSRIGITTPKPRSAFGRDGRATVRGADEKAAALWERFAVPEDAA
jgi:P27 family predicted phage terminase small subunit